MHIRSTSPQAALTFATNCSSVDTRPLEIKLPFSKKKRPLQWHIINACKLKQGNIFFYSAAPPFFSEPKFNDDGGHLSIHMMHRKLFPCRSRSKAVLISRRPTSCVTSPSNSSSLLMHFSARIGMSVLGLIPPKADPMTHLPNRSSRAGTHNRSVWFPRPRMIVLPLPCRH